MKRILITTPSLRPHGGIRVLIEWANHFHKRGYNTTLQVFGEGMTKQWANIDPGVSIVYGTRIADNYDYAVAGCPPLAIALNDAAIGAKKFYLLQMAEHLFSRGNTAFNTICKQSYRVPYPIIGISRWVEHEVKETGRPDNAPMYYIGNGVSDEFYPTGKKEPEPTILVEGWESYGDAKDVATIGPKVAKRLKESHGVRVLAYSQFQLKTMTDVPDEYVNTPDMGTLVSLYNRAHIILKASLLDARSCAPVEAMACGTVPVRAIRHGDDDLFHNVNCLRSGYDEEAMYQNAVRLLEDQALRHELRLNGLEYRKKQLSWEYWIGEVEKIMQQ